MIQEMIRNDPQFANMPMLEQAMEEMRNNPEIVANMSQMMSDPNVQRLMSSPEYVQSMQQRLQQSFTGGNRSGTTGSNPTPLIPPNLFPPTATAMGNNISPWGTTPQPSGSSNNNINSTSNNSTSRTDDELTEEEMIAEAIRRSLQDNNNNN
jgi:hypothetical protein